MTCLHRCAPGASTRVWAATQFEIRGQACAQYRYDANIKDSSGNFVAPSDTIYPKQSLYTIRIGARISF